jgi:hypothetical protein
LLVGSDEGLRRAIEGVEVVEVEILNNTLILSPRVASSLDRTKLLAEADSNIAFTQALMYTRGVAHFCIVGMMNSKSRYRSKRLKTINFTSSFEPQVLRP